ncbi:L-seryl-tRNA(Sec) selenium transferase [Rhodoplanes elegans]|uniref:L-seryl-tRNA(Sec) selenium transferase n=1 Tax=Rhodoplanes elegans TaxID=29408 RepID=A0A327KUX2_9BRAD|nr:L-seryl-tRNA(Sec) selenium transferase [Rhodoplanes elegans]MBK5957630.1 L-seryl-tRNA(Sec) selenium transferase [Rhodoplanes elegans]RAI41275.1 L-seryl-tRNA(Sec) selenium transferase [Rhodoplanes elegans]
MTARVTVHAEARGAALRRLPSVDDVLKTDAAAVAIERFGRTATVAAVRTALDETRAAFRAGGDAGEPDVSSARVAGDALARMVADAQPAVRPVFNLTGVVLHTNLGRAVLAEAAIEAAVTAMRRTIALEFDLSTGKRGERDTLVRDLLCELTGAEDATVVNNNAAAVLLVLATLAKGREAIVSRGELIEIGGAFRMPDIMARAGAKLVEVGTTNRTHPKDYAAALNDRTGLVLKVHTSNYRIEGFTSAVPARDLVALARDKNVPVVDDLGSGTLIDLTRFGLAHEPTVAEAVAAGADLVTFSGDKLLGGPQAGFVVGRRDLIQKINRNPMKRALRVDKIRLAAIEATLKLYRDPDRLAEKLPTLRHLARPQADILAQARRLQAGLATAVGEKFDVTAAACNSQIGSGALPQETLPSAALTIRPRAERGAGRALETLAKALRDLPVPVIGRIADGALVLDLRCLDDEVGFLNALASLRGGADGLA